MRFIYGREIHILKKAYVSYLLHFTAVSFWVQDVTVLAVVDTYPWEITLSSAEYFTGTHEQWDPSFISFLRSKLKIQCMSTWVGTDKHEFSLPAPSCMNSNNFHSKCHVGLLVLSQANNTLPCGTVQINLYKCKLLSPTVPPCQSYLV